MPRLRPRGRGRVVAVSALWLMRCAFWPSVEMRSLGFSVCANILVYFNENGSPYELRNKRAYLQGMTRLQSLAATAELHSEVDERDQRQRCQSGADLHS